MRWLLAQSSKVWRAAQIAAQAKCCAASSTRALLRAAHLRRRRRRAARACVQRAGAREHVVGDRLASRADQEPVHSPGAAGAAPSGTTVASPVIPGAGVALSSSTKSELSISFALAAASLRASAATLLARAPSSPIVSPSALKSKDDHMVSRGHGSAADRGRGGFSSERRRAQRPALKRQRARCSLHCSCCPPPHPCLAGTLYMLQVA